MPSPMPRYRHLPDTLVKMYRAETRRRWLAGRCVVFRHPDTGRLCLFSFNHAGQSTRFAKKVGGVVPHCPEHLSRPPGELR